MTHPLGFSHSEPSVAALVGSLDKECSQFASRVWLQGHRIEMLQVGASLYTPAACAGEGDLERLGEDPSRDAACPGTGNLRQMGEECARHAAHTGLGDPAELKDLPGWPVGLDGKSGPCLAAGALHGEAARKDG